MTVQDLRKGMPIVFIRARTFYNVKLAVGRYYLTPSVSNIVSWISEDESQEEACKYDPERKMWVFATDMPESTRGYFHVWINNEAYMSSVNTLKEFTKAPYIPIYK